MPTCILDLNRARHAASFYAVPIAFSAFRRDFFFRFAVEAQACSDAVGIAPHQALVALCCPAFGLCCTTAGFRVSPTAQQLRPFICGAWPELTDHKIADTGECFEDAAYYTITHPSCPLTAWLRAGGAHDDVLFLPVDVRPETGIPCSPGLYPHVFRHEGVWGLYDLRAGPPVDTPLGAFASRALTAFAAAAGGETPSSASGCSVSSDVSSVEHIPGPVLSITSDPDPVTVSVPDALSPHSPLFRSPDSAADPSSDDGLVLLQTRSRYKAWAVSEASAGSSSTCHRALADSLPKVPRCRLSVSCRGRLDTRGLAPASTLRALPTPCRTRRLTRGALGVSAPDLSAAVVNAPLVVADAGHEDGLDQASRTCGVPSCPASPAPATPVFLHSALQLEAPTFFDCSSVFARADWLFLRRDTESVPGMLPTCRALSARGPGDARSCCRLHVYTDGSFLPDPTLSRAGWAFAVFTESCGPGGSYFGFLGFAGGSLRPWLRTALNIDCDCYDAECIALALACAWCLAVPQLVMHFDSISAGGAASGRAQPRRPQDSRTAAATARYCAQALEAAGHNVHWQWVRGHSGSLGNEVCDAVSRACAADVFDASPISTFAWQAFLSPHLPWLWRHFAVSSTCPSMEALCSGVYEPADKCSPCLVPAACPRGATSAPCKAKLSVSFCSFNVQTLRDVKGMLWEQFVKAGLHVVGLQETRLRSSSFIEGSSFFEFHAAATNGDGGVSLLFSRTAPYGFMQGKPLRFAKHHLRCLHSDSHCICVCVRAPFLAITVVAAHGPHSGHSIAAIRQWWADLEAVLPCGHDLVILADCNARLGSVVSDGVGDHAPAAECPAGTALREFVARRDLWIPSTFHDQDGLHNRDVSEPTWHAPAGGDSRIDYVLLPMAWRSARCRPFVWYDVVLPRDHDDHWPAVLSCNFAGSGSAPSPSAPRPVRDPASLSNEARFALDFTWAHLGHVPWSVDVHTHTQYLFDHLGTCLPFVANRGPRRRTFLPDSTWQVVRFCRTLKRHLGFLDKQARALTLRALFLSWKASRFPVRAGPPANGLGWTLQDVACIRASCAWALSSSRQLLRRLVAGDKAAFVSRQVALVAHAGTIRDSKALYHALKPLRPASKRVLKPWSALCVAPALEEEAPTFQALQDAKASFFGDIEGGARASPEALAQAAQSSPRPSVPFALGDLPTLLQIECLARSTSSVKAPGTSGIPNYFWTCDPPRVAQHLLPLFIKSHVRLSEPVQFKDVSLVTLFKGKGSFQDLSNHRAICLMETPGKMLRKQLRPSLLGALRATDLHQGGIPGSLLQAGQHAVRTFLSAARAKGLPHAAYFLDVSSAYYRVIRCAFRELGETDEALVAVLDRLKVPPAYLHEVLAWASGSSLLERTSPHVRAFIAQTLQGTHFRVQEGSFLTQTFAGVRPGDALADVLFSFVQADFLRALELDLGTLDFFNGDLLNSTPLRGRLVAPTWADDTVPLVAAPDCRQLLQKVKALGSAVHRLLHQRGLLPNYSRGKTEVVLALIGPQSQKCRQELMIAGGGLLSFPVPEGTVQVRCVPSYTHLGGRVHFRGGILPDILQKSASAFSAVAPFGDRSLGGLFCLSGSSGRFCLHWPFPA